MSDVRQTETVETVATDSADSPRLAPQNSDASTLPVFDDSALMDSVVDYDESVERAIREWQAAEQRSVLEPLGSLLETCKIAASELLRNFNSADLSSAAACRDQVLRLRGEAQKRVVKPAQKFFADTPPSSGIADAFAAMLQALERASEKLDPDASIVDREDRFESDPADTLWLRTKKWNYRRRIRRSGDGLVRAVDALNLARYNSIVRMPLFLFPLHEQLQQRTARHVAALERALADWINVLLTLERPLHSFVPDRGDRSLLDCIRKPTRAEVTKSEAATDSKSVKSDVQEQPAADVERTNEAIAKVLDGVRSSTQEFIDELTRLIGVAPVVELPAPQLVNGALRSFREDLSQTGTPFLNPAARVLITESAGIQSRVARTRSLWLAWTNQIGDRLILTDTLLTLREKMLEAEAAILTDAAKFAVKPVDATFARIKALLAESASVAHTAAETVSETGDLLSLRSTINELKSDNDRFLSRTLRDLPGMVSADELLSDPASRSWPSVLAFVDASPEQLEIHELVADPDRHVNPNDTPRVIRLRDRLMESIQPVTRKYKPSGEALRKVLLQIWTEVEKTKTAVEYSLDTATAELDRILSGAEVSEDDQIDNEQSLDDNELGIQRTTELVVKGYERAIGTLDDMLPMLREPWDAFSETVTDEVQQQWAVALRKARTGDADATDWEGSVALLRRTWQSVIASLSETWSRIWTRSKTWFIAVRRRTKKLIRIGQTAVGAIEAKDEDLAKTLDEVGRITELRRELPLVYRHLFAFEPLVEPALFEGRTDDITWVRERFRRWAAGERSGALIFSAPIGAGRTTFLNILAGALLQDFDYEIVRPARRLTEAELVRLLATTIDVPVEDGDLTLDALEQAIIAKGTAEKPFVCLIDDLELLLLRSAGGSALLERLLLLMSRTDSCVYWISTIGELAWRYLTSIATSASAYLTHRSLTPVTRESLELVILARHKRSAMPLRFAPSQAQADNMLQWLKRTRSAEERQEHARAQYFDRLFRLSGQSIMLALFYWIRSAEFSQDAAAVEISPIEPLKFETLSRYSLPQAFALEAFMFHKTLSLNEHNAVLRASPADGTMLIEALLNARILTRVRAVDDERDPATNGQILPEDRFRIRPLLVNPVRSALSQRHLVY